MVVADAPVAFSMEAYELPASSWRATARRCEVSRISRMVNRSSSSRKMSSLSWIYEKTVSRSSTSGVLSSLIRHRLSDSPGPLPLLYSIMVECSRTPQTPAANGKRAQCSGVGRLGRTLRGRRIICPTECRTDNPTSPKRPAPKRPTGEKRYRLSTGNNGQREATDKGGRRPPDRLACAPQTSDVRGLSPHRLNPTPTTPADG